MKHTSSELLRSVRTATFRDGILGIKDEAGSVAGLPVYELTLQSTGAPVHPDERWLTKREAERITKAWSVELFEY